MSCCCCCCGAGTAAAEAQVESSEEIICSTPAKKLLDCTGVEPPESRTVGSAILVRSRSRPTEGALLVFSRAPCCTPRLLATIPLCVNIDLQFGLTSDAAAATSSDGAPKKIILELEGGSTSLRDGDRSAAATPLLADCTRPAKEGKTPSSASTATSQSVEKAEDEEENSESRLLKNVAAMQAIAERYAYRFPSQKGNHDWLFSYGSELLPIGVNDQWYRLRMGSDSTNVDDVLRRKSFNYGGPTSIRTFVADNDVPWDMVQPALSANESEFLMEKPLHVSVVTLNCGEQMPPPNIQSLTPLFAEQAFGEKAEDDATAEIVAVALQETCPLVVAVDVTDTVPARHHAAWKRASTQALEDCRGGYQLAASVHLVGLLLLLFVKSELVGKLQDVRTGYVRTGAFGAGNKGAVAARFMLHSTSICIVNSHLAAGENEDDVAARTEDFGLIVSNLRVGQNAEDNVESSSSTVDPHSRGANLFEHDAVFWAGDMNMRLWKDTSMKEKIAREEVFSALEEGDKQRQFMLEHDELHIQRAKDGVYAAFDELPINFMPSYKLKSMPQTARLSTRSESQAAVAPHPANEKYFYDTKRAPAWTDRVLWRARGSTQITPHSYERIPTVNFSDHRPVRLGLTVIVRDIGWNRVREICQDVKEQMEKSPSPDDSGVRRHDSILGIYGDESAASNQTSMSVCRCSVQ